MSMRVAVRLDAGDPRTWQVRCIEALQREGASIVAVVRADRSDGARGEDRCCAALQPARLPEAVAICPASGPDSAPASPHPLDVDVVIDFGAHGSPPAVGARHGRAVARPLHGIWRFRFGDDDRTPIAFAELFRGDRVVDARLMRDDGAILKRGWFETTGHSRAETVETVLDGVASWPAQVAREISAGLPLLPCDGEAAAAGTHAVVYSPAMAVMLKAKMLWRGLLLRLHYLFRHEHWNVAVVPRPIGSFEGGGIAADAQWFPAPPRGHFSADPFGLPGGGALDVMCEEFDYRDRRGYLSYARITPADGAPSWAPAMRAPVHLSYPYLLRYGGAIYCIPESSAADEIAIFEAVDFPRTWRRAATLISGFAGCDATAFEHDGRWWLLATGKDGPNRTLYAWHAPSPLGPWSAHARNPVKIDARSARPAGTPFVSRGRLLRPAQDCAGGYGRRIALMHVTRLTPTEFEESIEAWIEPDPRGPYPYGLHTLSAAGERTLIDGKRYRFVPSEFARTLAHYARALAGFKGSGSG